MSDDDIIEIGEDGSFDIKPSAPVKQPARKEIDYSNYDWTQLEKQQNLDLLQSLQANEYALYKKEDGLYWLIFKLHREVGVSEVLLAGNEIRLILSTEQKVDIELPKNVQINANSAQSKHFKDYVTIQFHTS